MDQQQAHGRGPWQGPLASHAAADGVSPREISAADAQLAFCRPVPAAQIAIAATELVRQNVAGKVPVSSLRMTTAFPACLRVSAGQSLQNWLRARAWHRARRTISSSCSCRGAIASHLSGMDSPAQHLDHKSSVALVPPRRVWDQIQHFRCFRDKGFVRWYCHWCRLRSSATALHSQEKLPDHRYLL